MAVDNFTKQLDPVGMYIQRKIQEQPWYKKYANTITAVVGFLVTIAAYLGSTPFGVYPAAQSFIVIAGFLATVFGISQTRNGFSNSQIKKINKAAASFVDNTPLIPNEPVNLDAQIKEYNLRRE